MGPNDKFLGPGGSGTEISSRSWFWLLTLRRPPKRIHQLPNIQQTNIHTQNMHIQKIHKLQRQYKWQECNVLEFSQST